MTLEIEKSERADQVACQFDFDLPVEMVTNAKVMFSGRRIAVTK